MYLGTVISRSPSHKCAEYNTYVSLHMPFLPIHYSVLLLLLMIQAGILGVICNLLHTSTTLPYRCTVFLLYGKRYSRKYLAIKVRGCMHVCVEYMFRCCPLHKTRSLGIIVNIVCDLKKRTKSVLFKGRHRVWVFI